MASETNESVAAVLLLGSNLGNRKGYLDEAIQSIIRFCGNVVKASSFYQTSAWGNNDQPDFLNVALQVSTLLGPDELWWKLSSIEQDAGRERHSKWGPRTLDIDILYYGSAVIQSTILCIPHPGIPQRRFTLVPLCEIMPDFVHPVLKKNHRQLLEECLDATAVEYFEKPI